MPTQPHRNLAEIGLRIGFWATVMSIPLLSFAGRRLQHWLEATLDKSLIGWLIITLLTITLMAYIVRHMGQWRRLWWRLLFGILLLGLIIEFVPVIEERIHFILFGALCYLGTLLFGVQRGLLICVVFSVGDEIFQWFLPDRVGDMRDVVINLIASSIGVLLAFSDRRTE